MPNTRVIIAGLHDQGLYRVVGVSSKVNKLITLGLGKGYLVCVSNLYNNYN